MKPVFANQLFIVSCIDIFKRMWLPHIQLFSIKEVVLCLPSRFFPVICFSTCWTLHGVLSLPLPFRSYHSYKVQQIHARLVGFGVSQFEQRWNPKSSGITCIAPLRRHIQGQNNPHVTDTHHYPCNLVWSEWRPCTHTPRPLVTVVLCMDKEMDAALSVWSKERKTSTTKSDSQHSCSCLLSAPNEGWSVIQDSWVVLGEGNDGDSILCLKVAK